MSCPKCNSNLFSCELVENSIPQLHCFKCGFIGYPGRPFFPLFDPSGIEDTRKTGLQELSAILQRPESEIGRWLESGILRGFKEENGDWKVEGRRLKPFIRKYGRVIVLSEEFVEESGKESKSV